MTTKDKTAAKRSSKLRQSYRERGYVPVLVWAHPDYRERIQALAAESRGKALAEKNELVDRGQNRTT